jgi:hypothetical protein
MKPETALVSAAIAVLVLAPLLSVIAWRRRPTLGKLVLVLSAGAVGAAWALATQLVRTDYRDADGFVDCWPDCTALQESVSWVLFLGPLAALALAGLATLTALRPRK